MRKNPRLEVKESKSIIKIILVCVASMVSAIIIACLLFFPVWPVNVTTLNFEETASLIMGGESKQIKVITFNNDEDTLDDDFVPINHSLNAYDYIDITIENKSYDFSATGEDKLSQRYFIGGWSHADLDRDGDEELLIETTALTDGGTNSWIIYDFKDGELSEVQRIPKGNLRRSLIFNKMSSTYSLMIANAPNATAFFELDF